MEKLLGAVLIVKNEAKVIEKTLASVVEWCDGITVLDTGSTDGTQEILRAKGVVLAEESFVNFDYAASRNRALEIAAERNKSQFTLSISADETLIGGEALRDFLGDYANADDAYCVLMESNGRRWPFPRVLKTGGGWKYVNATGNLHEAPVGPDGEKVQAKLIPGVVILHEESDPARKLERLRERDLPVLTAIVEDESKSFSDRLEPMYQLAETHFSLGHNDRDEKGERPVGGRWLTHLFTAMAMYTRYAEIAEAFADTMKGEGMDDWKFVFQKAMYARYMYLRVAESFGLFEPTELVKRLTGIVGVAPQIPEVHWSLAQNASRIDVRKAIPLAMKAAKVARIAYDNPVLGPTDTRIEWQAYLLAADCARLIKDKRLQYSFAKDAVRAGAPLEQARDLMQPEARS